MFSAAIDSGEGFFREQTDEAVFACHLFEDGHRELLVVVGDVGSFENRGNFVLARGDLVVARLEGDAELESFALDFHHVGEDAVGNCAKVLIFKLLAACRACAKESAPAGVEVGAQVVKARVYEEVFLLGAGGGGDEASVFMTEEFQDALRLAVEGLHGAQERGFFVKGLAFP